MDIYLLKSSSFLERGYVSHCTSWDTLHRPLSSDLHDDENDNNDDIDDTLDDSDTGEKNDDNDNNEDDDKDDGNSLDDDERYGAT